MTGERAHKAEEEGRHLPERLPLVLRKRVARSAARGLVQRRTTRGLTIEQRALRPLVHARAATSDARRTAAALVLALAVHGFLVGAGWRSAKRSDTQSVSREQPVRIEVRERAPVAPPGGEAPPESPKVTPPPPKAPVARREVAHRISMPTPRPPTEKPSLEPLTPKPPPRVIGLSLESTSDRGTGESFAVGSQRDGQTAARATAPAPSTASAPTSNASSPNQVASRIPLGGATVVPPKRRRLHEPAYPPLLKTQGIEADVTVMSSIGADGKVTKVTIVRPAPQPEFNQAARAAAGEEEFEPATRDGQPIPFVISYTYRFRLQGE